jgi:hypothetical protein
MCMCLILFDYMLPAGVSIGLFVCTCGVSQVAIPSVIGDGFVCTRPTRIGPVAYKIYAHRSNNIVIAQSSTKNSARYSHLHS